MSSQQGIGRASSAESSPRKFRARKSPHGESNSHSALQSAWIQRIIPLSSRGFDQVSQDHPALFLKNEEASKYVDRFVVSMEYDDKEDSDRDVSGFKFHAPSSWLTVRNSEREEMETFPAGSSPKPLQSAGSRGKVSLSSDSKVVPVMEDEVAYAKVGDSEAAEQKRSSSSAWFARIARKDSGETKQVIRSFPPLKSGEQWPGALKPSGLPPLRIPSSRSPERLEEIPFLTPVNAPAGRDDKDIPSGMKTISLKDSVDASGSRTCSLPSNFVMDRNDSDRTRSLQDNFGFFNGVVKPSRKNSSASNSSKTKSLFDGEDEEVQSVSRQEKVANNEDDLICEDINERLNRSKCNYQNEAKKHPYHDVLRGENHRKTQAQRSPGAQHTFKPERGEQIPLAFQLGSQQWLQRWCSSSNARTLNP